MYKEASCQSRSVSESSHCLWLDRQTDTFFSADLEWVLFWQLHIYLFNYADHVPRIFYLFFRLCCYKTIVLFWHTQTLHWSCNEVLKAHILPYGFCLYLNSKNHAILNIVLCDFLCVCVWERRKQVMNHIIINLWVWRSVIKAPFTGGWVKSQLLLATCPVPVLSANTPDVVVVNEDCRQVFVLEVPARSSVTLTNPSQTNTIMQHCFWIKRSVDFSSLYTAVKVMSMRLAMRDLKGKEKKYMGNRIPFCVYCHWQALHVEKTLLFMPVSEWFSYTCRTVDFSSCYSSIIYVWY